ncbi:septation ring formation regulator EzrA [Alteribacter natronophilus]|uniref:septation ring formation regulator EzrA n=1 Tax=Alteribacter natronophilus TaxID=2583810 RepID=UPI00110EF7D4|nr:septation ring formation regulator EzrA [Alteribacter natronophilus]TMW71738.1 septation ring formation regulator EzrA [Alteribacter natronophilus]
MDVILYSLAALIVIVIVTGAVMRKRFYKEVDRLEQWKMEIMNEPVTDEIAKIKGLTMSGETEQRFENWRSEWDHILTKQLPDAEERLFDIEEAANRYRFKKARKLISEVEVTLRAVEEHMKNMVTEINELVESEEHNREEIAEVQNYYDETKKKLWMKRSALGQAGVKLDQMIRDVHDSFDQFEEQTLEGNYLQARQTLEQLKIALQEINILVEEVPKYLVLIDKGFPKQIAELEQGLKEMAEKGYPLEHFSFYSKITEMKVTLTELAEAIDRVELEKVKEPVSELEMELEDIYEKLEYEALSKQVVTQQIHEIRARVDIMPDLYRQLIEETEDVKSTYKLTEQDYKQQYQLEKTVRDLTQQFLIIEDYYENQKQTFTALREMIREYFAKLEKGEAEMKQAKEVLEDMRSDERKAEETLGELKQQLINTQKKLKRSNIPGLPRQVLNEMDKAEEAFVQAAGKLDEVPLSVDDITAQVDRAHEHVMNVTGTIDHVIETATLAEKMIQYGNRYRRQSDTLNLQLLQAEDAFRNYQYEDALEMSVEALHPVDPKALEKVQNENEKTLQPMV